jgi:hypothetical protein
VFMLLPRKQAFFTALLLDQLAVCVLHIHSHQNMSSMERAVNTKKNHDISSVKPLVWWDGKRNEKHATIKHAECARAVSWSSFFIVLIDGRTRLKKKRRPTSPIGPIPCRTDAFSLSTLPVEMDKKDLFFYTFCSSSFPQLLLLLLVY